MCDLNNQAAHSMSAGAFRLQSIVDDLKKSNAQLHRMLRPKVPMGLEGVEMVIASVYSDAYGHGNAIRLLREAANYLEESRHEQTDPQTD